MKFNPVFIDGTTIGDTWFQLLWACNKVGRKYLITKGSYEGSYRLALDDASGVIRNPHDRPLAPIMPEGSNLPAPTTDEAIETYFVNYLMDGNKEPNEDYRYATFVAGGKYLVPKGMHFFNPYQIGRSGEIFGMGMEIIVPNQVQWVIDHFKTAGFGNEHCYIQVGYPESNRAYDIPYTTETERRTSPCLRGIDFRIIEDPLEGTYLTTKVIFRSWDLWGGFPENMGGIALLNEYVAGELGINPGPLTFASKSLHVYDFHLEVLKLRLGH